MSGIILVVAPNTTAFEEYRKRQPDSANLKYISSPDLAEGYHDDLIDSVVRLPHCQNHPDYGQIMLGLRRCFFNRKKWVNLHL